MKTIKVKKMKTLTGKIKNLNVEADLIWRKEQLRQIAAGEPVTVIRKSTAREIELTSFAIPARPGETAEYTDEQREIQ